MYVQLSEHVGTSSSVENIHPTETVLCWRCLVHSRFFWSRKILIGRDLKRPSSPTAKDHTGHGHKTDAQQV